MQTERDRRKREKCKVGEEEACIMQYNKQSVRRQASEG